MRQPLVIVGASLAGLRAAEAARRSGWEEGITLIGDEPHLPYDRPPLSKTMLKGDKEPPFAPFRTREHLEDDLGVTLALGVHAEALDLTDGVVGTTGGPVPYAALVVATGSTPRGLPGVELGERVMALRSWDDAKRLRSRLRASRRIAIVGAGFIGAEIASAAVARDVAVTIVEAAPLPLVRAVGKEVSRRLINVHAEHGVELMTSTTVREVRHDQDGAVIVLGDGRELWADTVVIGIGTRPQTDWLEQSGLQLDDGIVCDTTLRAAPNVYAAGDVARWPNPVFDGEMMRLEHWTSAAEQGAAGGANAASSVPTPFGTVPFFWSDWYGSRLQFIGRPSDDVEIIDGDTPGRFLALYRSGQRLVGAFGLQSPAVLRHRLDITNRTDYSTLRSAYPVVSVGR